MVSAYSSHASTTVRRTLRTASPVLEPGVEPIETFAELNAILEHVDYGRQPTDGPDAADGVGECPGDQPQQ